MRMGIDVGGTNTDALLIEGKRVVGWFKTPTTPDVTSGITTAMKTVLEQTKVPADQIQMSNCLEYEDGTSGEIIKDGRYTIF